MILFHIKGHTIQPSGAFQQATRTRNIKNLYFYGETPNKKAIYNDIEEVKQTFKNNINTCKNLKTLCTYINEENEEDIVENSFFNLFCYQEYVKDIYAYLIHLERRETTDGRNLWDQIRLQT